MKKITLSQVAGLMVLAGLSQPSVSFAGLPQPSVSSTAGSTQPDADDRNNINNLNDANKQVRSAITALTTVQSNLKTLQDGILATENGEKHLPPGLLGGITLVLDEDFITSLNDRKTFLGLVNASLSVVPVDLIDITNKAIITALRDATILVGERDFGGYRFSFQRWATDALQQVMSLKVD